MNTGSSRSGLGTVSISRFAVLCALLCVAFGIGGCVPQKRVCRLTIKTDPPGGRIYSTYSHTALMGTSSADRFFEVPGTAATNVGTGPWHAVWDDAKTEPCLFTMQVPAGLPQEVEAVYDGKPTKVYPFLFVIRKPVVTPVSAAQADHRSAPKPAAKSEQQAVVIQSSNAKATPVGKAAPTTVIVSAEPEDCEVLVNGLLVGTAPARLNLPDGVHVIEVTKEGYKRVRKELRVITGSDAVLRVKLEPN